MSLDPNSTNPGPATAELDPTTLTPKPRADLVDELGQLRKLFVEVLRDQAAALRAERRRQLLVALTIVGLPLLSGLLCAAMVFGFAGVRWGPFSDAAAVIRIEGVIGSKERASADTVIPLLEDAFSSRAVKAVILSIDSPGGAPVEAERIAARLDSLKKQHPKPVAAVVQNLGASAAYLLALHTDTLVAGRYSLVGSVGAIMSPWQLDRALARLDVHQRAFASGRLKEFLNPFTPPSPAAEAKAQALVDEVGQRFASEVRTLRGDRLNAKADIATGEIWSGPEAHRLGLIDQVGTLEEFVASKWGLKPCYFEARQAALPWLAQTLQDVALGTIQALASGPAPMR